MRRHTHHPRHDTTDAPPVTAAPADDDRLRTAASEILADVADALVDIPEGGQTAPGFVAGTRGVHLKTRPGVYCGGLGVAVAMAGLGHVTGTDQTDRVRAWASQAMDAEIDTVLERPYAGAGTGYGSDVYGLTLLAALTGESRYADRRDALVDAFDERVFADDNQYDVLLGSAGVVHALLACHETTGSDAALSAARACGDHLLENRYEKWNAYGLWDTSRVDGLYSTATGAGHGVAGIAHALYRLWSHTGAAAYREAADDAVAFENTFYADRENNWKMNFGGVRHYTDWWCSGRVGVAAARHGSLTAVAAREREGAAAGLSRDVDRAAAGLAPRLLASDSLCHGTAGVLDALVDLRDHPAVGDDDARRLATALLDRREESGHLRVTHGEIEELDNPALFLGTGGVAYALSRVVDPSLPALTRFAAPTEVDA